MSNPDFNEVSVPSAELPTYAPPAYPEPTYAAPACAPPAYLPPAPATGLHVKFAFWSFGLGLGAIVSAFAFLGAPAAILAVIFGHLSLHKYRDVPEPKTGRWASITGLVLGYVGVAGLLLIVGLFGLLTIGSLLHRSAIGSD